MRPGRCWWTFDRLDWLGDALRARHLAVLGVLGYSASWASSDPGRWNAPPREDGACAAYVAATVEHFRGRVDYWELWNEPNSSVYWSTQDGLVSYGRLLRAAYAAAKRANPSCVVLHGGLTGDVTGGVERLYALGLDEAFDVVNIHLLMDPHVTDVEWILTGIVDEVRDTMARHGDSLAPLWVTELGCPGVPRGVSARSWGMGSNPTEAEQADYVAKSVGVLVKLHKAERVFWAFLQDTEDHFHSGVDFFGLLRRDFKRKPSYRTYRTLIAQYAH